MYRYEFCQTIFQQSIYYRPNSVGKNVNDKSIPYVNMNNPNIIATSVPILIFRLIYNRVVAD